MKIETLDLSHQDVLENKFHTLHSHFSEYSFANLYLFRKIHNYEVLKDDEEVFIKGITRDHVSFIMLTSHPANLSPLVLQKVLSFGQILFPLPEKWLPSLERFLVQTSFTEDDSDYLFATSKLATFPGRHLSKKRNLIKQLLTHHEVKGENFSQQVEEALHILEDWQHENARDLIETDYLPCQEAIHHFQKLHLHGRIIYVDQKAVGFTIGEWISSDCYAVHFAKALRSIKGLYQYLYQDLAQVLKERTLWMNLEQDLGILAIRDAKHSYLPDQVLRKWRVQVQF